MNNGESGEVKKFPLSHVTIHGHDVGYRRGGQGETVLLLHGLAGSSRTWRAVLPELSRTHDVIAPDLLGHGESAKPMGDYSLGAFASGLRDFLAALDVPSATIVGHSFGGGVAMQLAYQHPELCDRLVLVSSGGLGREVSWLLRLLTLPGAEQLMPLMFPRVVADRGDGLGRLLGRFGLSSPTPRGDVACLRLARRRREPQGIRSNDSRGDRTGRADRQRARSSVSGRPRPHADRLGQPRRHHPGRSMPQPLTRRSPEASLRCSSASATSRTSRRPIGSCRCWSTSSVRPRSASNNRSACTTCCCRTSSPAEHAGVVRHHREGSERSDVSAILIRHKGLRVDCGVEHLYALVMGTGACEVDEIVLSPAEFIDAWAAHERNAARLGLAASRLDGCGSWAVDGSVSIAAWLRQHCRMSNRDANALVHRGRFLDKFPAIADAARTGTLSAGQVTALNVSCPAPVEPIMSAQQAEVVAIVAPLSVADSEQAMAMWRQRAEALVESPEPSEPDRQLRTAVTAEGLVGRFVLDDAGAVQFQQAIRQASSWDGSDDTRDTSRRSADALVDVCAFFNANHDRPGRPRQRPHIELNIDADTLTERPLATTVDGTILDHLTTETLLCDCVIHRVQRAGNAILSYGRATRTVPIDLFRATAARDGGCRFPGCDRKIAWCDAHHIHYWRHLGLTELRESGAVVQPPPPSDPPTRLAVETAPQRRPRSHLPRRNHQNQPTPRTTSPTRAVNSLCHMRGRSRSMKRRPTIN